MIYLASLFSNGAKSNSGEHREIRKKRYEYTLERLAELKLKGEFVYSPIVHCYDMSNKFDMSKTYEFWKQNDRHFISKSDKLLVLRMKDSYGDWKQSKGIQDEVNFAESLGIEVEYLLCLDYNKENR